MTDDCVEPGEGVKVNIDAELNLLEARLHHGGPEHDQHMDLVDVVDD